MQGKGWCGNWKVRVEMEAFSLALFLRSAFWDWIVHEASTI